MKKYLKMLVVLAVSVSVVFVFSLAGCKPAGTVATETAAPATETAAPASETTTETTGGVITKASKEWVIVDVPKLAPTPYFDRGAQGLKEASEKFGINAYQIGAIDFDSSAQVKIIEDLIAKNVDAILACAIDPNSMVPVLKKAMDSGILTMAYSSPVDESAITWDVRSLDDKEFGEHIWDTLVQFMGDSGEYAVLTGQIDTPDHTMWFNYGTEYAKVKYPNLKLVTERIPTDEKLEVAYSKTIDLLKTYPNLKGFIGLGAGNPPGIAKAIREKGLAGKIAVVGTGLPSMSKEYLKDGSLSIASLWDPKGISIVAAYVAMLTLEGQPVTDGMEVPGFGKIRVDGKVIIPGSYTDFTAENVDDYPF
ncbi:MAG: substrate-binding domain-containing protein [Actinobacteria bacterium]|nr:substrate-binding domain-containing protein [Actinomycetota bacterium]